MQGLRGGKPGDRHPRPGGRLLAILRLNLVFLVGLLALTFFLPLSSQERLFLAPSMAVLAGANWALLEHARR